MNVPIDFLKECFSYNAFSGQILWNERPKSHFSNDTYWRMWNTSHAWKIAGSPMTNGYLMVQIRHGGIKTGILAHRIAWAITHGHWPDWLDHANGNRQDNRITNLRKATSAQNAWNTLRNGGKHPAGVAMPKRSRKFIARITVNGTCTHIGSFDTAYEAHAAYVKARNEIHKEFSVERRSN